MADNTSPVIFFFFICLTLSSTAATTSPYLSHTTIFQNYQNMLKTFKIFIYTPTKPFTFSNLPSSLFYTSLLNSSFVTLDPNEAHLFFLPFSPDLSTRSIARLVKDLRNDFPYWNRTLGADHFFISPTGISYTSDRNIVELKKNAVQISDFPTTSGNFIPHKDITFPPFNPTRLALAHRTKTFLGYLKWDGKTEAELVNELKKDDDFVVETEHLDHGDDVGRRVENSKYCLYFYSDDVSWMVERMVGGCVPVVIVKGPIQDLPLMDVLKWSEMAVLVGTSGGAKGVKEVLEGISEEKCDKMRELGMVAGKHMMWNTEAQPLDAFHMVVYQLWLRRHTIRYARRESA